MIKTLSSILSARPLFSGLFLFSLNLLIKRDLSIEKFFYFHLDRKNLVTFVTFVLKYTEQGESGSKSFKPTLEIYSSTLRAQILGFLAATANQEIFILAKTRNGDWHLLGDEYEGVEHESAEATSGKLGSDNHGALITFFTETDAPTIYKGDVDSLTLVGGTRAAISSVSESVSGDAATLSATVTDNDDDVTEVGFVYKAEGSSTTVRETVANHTSGSAFSVTVEDLESGDYIYYAYMVANGV